LKLLTESQLELLESHLRLALDEAFHGSVLRPFTNNVRDYVLAGGKRIRPQMCLWSYQRMGHLTEGVPVSLLDVAIAWELFHAFLLAHDDIIDQAPARRNQASLHRQLALLDGDSATFGTNLGIVAGDLLFGLAMKRLHDADLSPAVYRPVLQLFSRIACLTGYGQAIDIWQTHLPPDAVDEASLLLEYHWKTAAYTFEGPMLAGAIVGGLGTAGQAAISRYALALGQAYQIQNDLFDLQSPAHDGCDLVQGKRTLTLLHARQGLDQGDRGRFDQKLCAIMQTDGQAVGRAETMRQELLDMGALASTQDVIKTFLHTARSAAGDRALGESFSTGLNELLDRLEEQYFRSTAESST